MRISDWSSDVCSSDLRIGRTRPGKGRRLGRGDLRLDPLGRAARKYLALDRAHLAFEPVDALRDRAIILRIGHAGPETEAGGGDRKSVVQGTGVAVRVVLGGGRIL